NERKMQRALFCGLLIGLLVVGPASAALIIDVGDHILAPNSTGQVVQIFATGWEAGDEQVTGFNLRAQLGDGDGTLDASAAGTDFDEPVFQSIDFTGGIWDAYDWGDGGGPVGGAEYWAQADVTLDETGDAVNANGLIATLTIDTTDYFAGTFALNLAGPPLGDSDYVGQPLDDIINGTITLNAIPEPAVMVQLFGLMAAMGPWFWLRKRNR
ncbi:hypothetical protein ACFL5Q_07485, partial [Planctomycetota bacterium]